jgi:hypothetical protein
VGGTGAAASLRLLEDGSFALAAAPSAAGGADETEFATAAADALGIPTRRVVLAAADTDSAPFEAGDLAPAFFSAGRAVEEAAELARERIRAAGAALLEVEPEAADVVAGEVRGPDDRRVSFATIGASALRAGQPLVATAAPAAGSTPPADAAVFAEIEVDTETGVVRPLRLTAVVAGGPFADPRPAEAQVEGALAAALERALAGGSSFDAGILRRFWRAPPPGGRPLSKPVPAVLLLATLLPAPSLAQTSPFLPADLHRALVNEISGDRSFEYVRELTHYHRTGPGRDFWAAAEHIRAAAEDAGLEDVRLIRQEWEGRPWSCRSGEAWLLGPEPAKLADFGGVAVSIADHSRTTHVRAPLVDVGAGTAPSDYEGREVEGRVVLAAGAPGEVMREAVWKRGALGVVSYLSQRLQPFDAPDQVAWSRIPYEARDVDGVEDGTPGTFAIMVSPRRGPGSASRAWSRPGSAGARSTTSRPSSSPTSRKRRPRPTTTAAAARTCSRSGAPSPASCGRERSPGPDGTSASGG